MDPPTSHTTFSSLTRNVEDVNDLAALVESFHRSSFAPLPSALTPSRVPSNTLIASLQPPFQKGPILLDFPSGWAKGHVMDWYNSHKSQSSTLIDKMQLRKDLQNPYYHEYIVVFTRGGRAYRVDRRPDRNAPFDTIMKQGCMAYDTIEAVGPRSLKRLETMSDCVVEFNWQGEQTTDLLLVLAICFGIREDKQAKQYTLQRYNCYFLSWTIVMITLRNTVARGARLNQLGRRLKLVVDWPLSRVDRDRRPWRLELNLVNVVWPVGPVGPVGPVRLTEMMRLTEILGLKGKGEPDTELRELRLRKLVPQELGLRKLVLQELGLSELIEEALVLRLQRELRLWKQQQLEGQQWLRVERWMAEERWTAEELMRPQEQLWSEEEQLQLKEGQLRLEEEQALVLALRVQLRRQEWLRREESLRRQEEGRQEKRRRLAEVRRKLELGQKLGLRELGLLELQRERELVRKPDSQGQGQERELEQGKEREQGEEREKGKEREQEQEQGRELGQEPEPSFSVSLQDNCLDTMSSGLETVTPGALVEHMMKVFANHATRVARWGLGPRAEVQLDMLHGMRRILVFLSQQSLVFEH